jgi:GDPmannose 4,6-dehydratase
MSDKKIALITGITGQDGSYLTELLLEKGYEVHGIIRRSSTVVKTRIDHLYQDPLNANSSLFLHYGDLSDGSNLNRLLEKICPQEIYHLGAQSHVRVSFDIPEYTADVSGLGTLRLLEALRDTELPVKLYNAASSEMFGNAPHLPITEETPFRPTSPYAISKLFSYWMTVNYRESYGMFAVNGILFNHESPRRGETFVTRKISRGLARVHAGLDDTLSLGNLDAKRDWGYAPEYVEGMWRMLQAGSPDDYILATNETHSVREFVEETARFFGYDIAWKGEGVHETGVDKKSGKTVIKIAPRYFRPTEVDVLLGDASKAKKQLGWEPKVTFKELVHIMAEAERDAVQHA